jgi:nucleoside-diphosphate-sugar epimerase
MFELTDVRKEQILVLGSNGFLGHNVCTYLRSLDYKVYGLNQRSKVSHSFQITMTELIANYQEYNFATAIFCGNPPISENEDDYFAETFFSDLKNANILKNLGFNKVIWTGSYWQDFVEQGLKEETLYTKSKRLTEESLLALADDSFRVASIRLGDTYGANDSREKIIPQMISALKKKELFTVKQPNSYMNLVSIVDVARGFEHVASSHSPVQQIYSVYADSLTSVKDLITEFNRVFPNFKYEITNSEQNFDLRSSFNLGIYPKPNNWTPKISLEEGLRNLKLID